MFPGQVTRLTEKTHASATTIVADGDIILLTGTTTIQTIMPKVAPFARAGQISFFAALDGSITLGTSGNIVTGGTILQNRFVPLVYSPTTGKWYPPIVA